MKPYLVSLAVAVLALAMGAGLSAENKAMRSVPLNQAGRGTPVVFVQEPVKITDSESLADFLKSKGYKDVKLVKGQNSYCEFIHEVAGAKMRIKGYGFPAEPVVDLYCELKMPEKVTAEKLLAVLQLAQAMKVFHRPADNKMVIHVDVFTNELGKFKVRADLILQNAQKVYTVLHPPVIDQ